MSGLRASVSGAAWSVVSVAVLGLSGCGKSGPELHPVSGKVEIPGGDCGLLAGSLVVASLEGDPTVTASGEIQPDGHFRLESLHGGAVRRGALEGRYRVRVAPTDDNPGQRRQLAKAVHPKYFAFDTSAISLQVPISEEVTIRLSTR